MPDDDKAARAEAQAILRHAEVCGLRDAAEEISAMYRSLRPTPSLDVDPLTLSDDPRERERQLVLLWLIERKFRRRLQDNARQLLEMLAG